MKLNQNKNVKADFELDNGVYLETKIGLDKNGSPVIREMKFFYPTKSIPQGGITAKTLREIHFQEILKEHFKQESNLDLSPSERAKLLKFVKNGLDFSGRTGFPKEFYAALAYLYVDTFEKHPKEPTVKLSEILEIPKRTLVNRLAMARKLDLLTQQSLDRPSGKAGGAITNEAFELIRDFLLNK